MRRKRAGGFPARRETPAEPAHADEVRSAIGAAGAWASRTPR